MSSLNSVNFNPILTPSITQSDCNGVNNNHNINGKSFKDLLDTELSGADGVTFSKHAMSRLESRNISLDNDDMEKLEEAVNKATDKGINDSLIVIDNLAFIVSVKDKKVITAMPMAEANSNVFTNIDGAVFI